MPVKWNYPRYPLDNELENLLRFETYWKYLLCTRPEDDQRSPLLILGDHFLKDIKTEEQADYEAYHLVHSIGVNFYKYSQLGDNYSIRTQENKPLCTLLVHSQKCIHARQIANDPLNDQNFSLLTQFCQAMGFTWAPLEEL